MELQILDCDYVMLSKPVIRIFGKTLKGETVCAFYDKFNPYFYLHAFDESKYPEIMKAVKEKFDKNIIEFEIVERFIPTSYSEKPVKVLKITEKDPAITREVREFVKTFGVSYESDILFKYRFMADFDLRGMGWINLLGKPTKTTTVKCKAMEAEEIQPIDILENAPLKILAIDIECVPDSDRIAVAEKDPIAMISLAFSHEFKGLKSLVILSKPSSFNKDTIGCDSEKEMMQKFLDIISEYDPDILTGYNFNNFDLPYILTRLERLNLPKDMGRSEKSGSIKKIQQKAQFGSLPNVSGRVVVDSYEIIKRDPWVKYKRYNLGTIATQLLGKEKLEMNGIAEMRELWNGNQEKIKKFVDYSRRDAELALMLLTEKGLLDKFFELSKISGLLLQDSLGGQSQRHEFKLLREFYKRKLLMPQRPDSTEMKKRLRDREKTGLQGALVLEPTVGLHEYVVVLDFTSLYPSLIRTYNICPTTFLKNGENVEHTVSPYGTKFATPKVREGVLPKIVTELITTRAEVRKQIKVETNKERKRILNAKQLALKDMANSLYGYTGYARSRLYVMDIANTITAFGRDTITRTKQLIEDNFPVKVLYADTDSTFLKADIKTLEEAEEMGKKISEYVTKNSHGLELKFEKIFKTFLIEAKKRYAGWSFERDNGKWVDKIEMKGIETVRRDWCELTSETMLEVLKIILKEKDVKKAAKYVRNVIDELAAGKIPIEKLSIVKGITKPIESYEGYQPHVEVAKKIRDRGKTAVFGGRLEFVIIKGNQILSKRAEDPAYAKEKGLEIDPHYYIYNQILPPLERIFEVCGVSSTELIEGVKQKKLMDVWSQQKEALPPEETVLKSYENVVCRFCDWSFRRPALTGNCPKCNSPLYFSGEGSIGKIVDLSKSP